MIQTHVRLGVDGEAPGTGVGEHRDRSDDRPMIRIGTSGWSYDHWDGVLYPQGTPPKDRLAHYVQHFDTVELNASFYRWPRDATFDSWRRRLPPGFLMSVKAPRGLTHAKRLYTPETWIDRIAAGWHELGDRRGVVLVQLAPGQQRDDDRLGWFLGRVPDWSRSRSNSGTTAGCTTTFSRCSNVTGRPTA
jgi:uncharacterized protein YecE (DUF72 family)